MQEILAVGEENNIEKERKLWKNYKVPQSSTQGVGLKLIPLLLSLVLLGSCVTLSQWSSKVKRSIASIQKAKAERVEPPMRGSDHFEKVKEAQWEAEDHNDINRIIGSAQIENSEDHHHKTYFLYGSEHLGLDNYYYDFPVVYNKKVKRWMDYFLNRGRGFFERYSARAGRYAPLMGKILEEHGLPRDLIFLAMAESGFTNEAKSWARAVGPWQFMPFTGRKYGLKIDWYKDERRDPIKATLAAASYLKTLYKEFGSWELAAAAYNAGEGKIGRAIRRYRTENFWRLSRGRYLRRETKNYVPKIMALAIIGKNLRSFGFKDIDFHEPLDFEEIDLPPMTDLYLLSSKLEVEFEEIQRLNPEILRWFTPPGETYTLRVPVGGYSRWRKCCRSSVDTLAAKDFMEYKVKGRRQRLKNVARRFRIKRKYIGVLTNLNPGMKANSLLKKGDMVYLPFRKGQKLRSNMYADLYERPRRSVRRRRSYRRRIRLAMKRGSPIRNPRLFYTVRRGDSLWTVARKYGISLDTLIASNLRILKKRQIRAGDKLAVR